MKYLCLAYGNEEDWVVLSKAEQDALLAQDEVLLERGGMVASVKPAVTTVRAPMGKVSTTESPFARAQAQLAGFSIIEAKDLDEVIELVSKTPCAQAGGAIEIRLMV